MSLRRIGDLMDSSRLNQLLSARKERYAEESCLRCGEDWRERLEGHREPWCKRCQEAHGAEYAPVFRAWLLERRMVFLERAGVPLRFQKCGLDNFGTRSRDQQRAVNAMQAWVTSGCASGLYLVGPVGTGKTHLGVAALLELLARRERGHFASAREFLLRCRDSFRSDVSLRYVLDDCTSTNALLLDDLGAEKYTEFARGTFDVLIDRCYSRCRPLLIVTSNLGLEGLARKLDDCIADRLRELCVVVKVGGPSYRRRIASARGGILSLGATPN